MFDTVKPRRLLRDPALDWHEGMAGARARIRASAWAAAQASLAAALAWWVARRLLGHPQPFFAPIAAAVAMSTNYFGRSRRAVQMVVGVLLGIGVAEVLSSLYGIGTIALGATVMITMLVALAVGGGFVGQGMMFVNQAAASAILVVALRRHGTGAERAVDALVGGGAALLVGVILFPAAPLPRLWAAERAVLDSLADALEHAMGLLEAGQPPAPEWTLAAGYDIHDKLGGLAEARARAKANVRIAPRRWHLRPVVDAEDHRIARFDLLANAVLSLVRAMVLGLENGQPLPPWLTERINTLMILLRKLAQTPQPWPAELVRDVSAAARRSVGGGPVAQVDRVPAVSAILRATGRDLAAVVDPES
jgi:uncharacterized membrane protein YgaE (UPF0421/DUF939 family)